MQKTIDKFKDRKILIWGYGREGRATEKLLKNYCQPASVEVYEGGREGIDDSRYDYIFVSPGIAFEEDAPLFDNPKFTSETEVFMEEYGQQTVGITGTKGKSTTTAMLAHVLQEANIPLRSRNEPAVTKDPTGSRNPTDSKGLSEDKNSPVDQALRKRKVFLMGNIGLPCFEYLPQMEESSLAVFELSCHQCQRLQHDPHIAVFLDLFEDHLDRYHTMAHYFDAKKGITKHQGAQDILYLGEEVPPLETRAQKIVIGDKDVRGDFAMKIPGVHNQYNAEFVYRIATEQFGVDPRDVRQAISTFHGLPHRLEYVATIEGVDYYDDSISTIPEATIDAMEAVKNAKTVLIGGMDRGIDYDILYAYIQQHPAYNFICAYASGKRIYDAVMAEQPPVDNGQARLDQHLWYVADLPAQVALAKEVTSPGQAVILSPAAASYGYFKNFEARGDAFQKLIGHIG